MSNVIQFRSKKNKLYYVTDSLIVVSDSLYASISCLEYYDTDCEYGRIVNVINAIDGVIRCIKTGYDRNMHDILNFVFEMRNQVRYIDNIIYSYSTNTAMVEANNAVRIMCNIK